MLSFGNQDGTTPKNHLGSEMAQKGNPHHKGSKQNRESADHKWMQPCRGLVSPVRKRAACMGGNPCFR